MKRASKKCKASATLSPMKLTSTQPLIDVEMVQSEAYWRKLCPKLQLSNGWVNPASEQAGQELLTKKEEQDLRARLDADGYCTLSAAQVGCTAKAASHLAAGVSLLKENGWPPTFILMFDEALELTAKAAAVAQAVTGNRPLMDIQASHVAPDGGRGDSHRTETDHLETRRPLQRRLRSGP